MEIKRISIKELKPAEYNPRIDLRPGDEEYEKIKRSIEEFGNVQPIIINTDMTIIGGHQRYKVLKDLGYKEIECSIVKLDKTREKALNIALNKISGDWDYQLLEKLMNNLNDEDFDLLLTGFDEKEIDKMLKESDEIISNNTEVNLQNFGDDNFKCQCPKCGFMFDVKG